MQPLIQALQALFSAIPLPLLETWGRLAFIIGALLAGLAYGGFTLRPHGVWGLGRIRQRWDTKSMACVLLTFVLVPVSGWLGANIVLVEGAQTFESLKDVMVFLTVVLFGYPALLAIPPAYMLSDLIEGVPPGFVFDWMPGYFFWTSFVWMAHQLIGRNPDFRRARTWGYYALFVLALMSFDPVMWGFICSTQFTSAISYSVISPAISFTLLVTWVSAPIAMLAALPLTRRLGLFWAESGAVTERRLRQSSAQRVSGASLGMVLAASFVALVLLLVGGVAYFSLRSGQTAAERLASQLHQEVADNLNFQLDAALDRQALGGNDRGDVLKQVLARSSLASKGLAQMIDRAGQPVAGSPPRAGQAAQDGVVRAALEQLQRNGVVLSGVRTALGFRFDVVSAKPLSRVAWLAQLTPYADNEASVDWLLLTAMPESHYLASVQAGSSQAALISAIALTLALAVAALLASLVAKPLHRIAQSAEAMAGGDLSQRVAPSSLQELSALAASFNGMAAQLQTQFERTLASEAKARAIFDASPAAMAVFDMGGFSRTDAGRQPQLMDINLAWQSTTGHAREQVLGKTSVEVGLWHEPSDRQRVAEQYFKGGAVSNMQLTLRRVDGSAFAAQFSMRRVDVSGAPLSVFVVEDISERLAASARLLELNQQLTVAQQDLLQLNAGLDQRVRERTLALEQSTTQLQSALDNLRRTQDQLVQSEKLASLGQIVARVAHEMNTPLGISVTAASTLQDRTEELRRDIANGALKRSTFDDYLNTMAAGLEMLALALARAHGLVDNFKRVAVDQSSGQHRAFDLHACIEAVHALVDTTLRGTPYLLSVDIPAGITMDSNPGAIEQVFINLVNNAVLHGFGERKHGLMRLSASYDDKQVRMVFEDDGRGMAETEQKRVFDPFYTTAAGRGGSGLGMTICFNLVTGTLGGTIALDSAPGRGTRVLIDFPRTAPGGAAKPG